MCNALRDSLVRVKAVDDDLPQTRDITLSSRGQQCVVYERHIADLIVMFLLGYVRGIEVLGDRIGREESQGEKEWTEEPHCSTALN